MKETVSLDINKITDYFFIDQNKHDILSYFSNQLIPYSILFILGILLCKNDNPILTVININIISVYAYLIHAFFHLYVPKKYNIHLIYHHDKSRNKTKLQKYLNLLIELITNTLFFVIFYLIKRSLKLNFINDKLIFYVGFVYVTTHIINYSILHVSKAHISHHKDGLKNYGPDFYDHLFNTNTSKDFEDLNHIIINSVVGFFITSVVFKQKILS